MAVKIEPNKTVEREVEVTVLDNNDVERPLIVELTSDGTVNLRLKGMKRVVTVDLLAALELGRDGEDPVLVSTEQKTTAKKRTMLEHLLGK